MSCIFFIISFVDGNVQEPVPAFNEGVISVEEARSRKPVPGPKGTIILFTVLILLFIAGIITISIWKNPFRVHILVISNMILSLL